MVCGYLGALHHGITIDSTRLSYYPVYFCVMYMLVRFL